LQQNFVMPNFDAMISFSAPQFGHIIVGIAPPSYPFPLSPS